MIKILFVCTGNICRSPTAEGVLRQRLRARGLDKKISVDSAGTHAYHVGEAPDPRSIKAAAKRGINITNLRGRKVSAEDFHSFDFIFGLDYEHMTHLTRLSPQSAKAHTALFLDYAGATDEKEVPDPYYGSAADFELVLDLVEAGVESLIDKLES